MSFKVVSIAAILLTFFLATAFAGVSEHSGSQSFNIIPDEGTGSTTQPGPGGTGSPTGATGTMPGGIGFDRTPVFSSEIEGMYWSGLIVQDESGRLKEENKVNFADKKIAHSFAEERPFVLEISEIDPSKTVYLAVGDDIHCDAIPTYFSTPLVEIANQNTQRSGSYSAGQATGEAIRGAAEGVADFSVGFWNGLTESGQSAVQEREKLADQVIMKTTLGLEFKVNGEYAVSQGKFYAFPLPEGLPSDAKLFWHIKKIDGRDVSELGGDVKFWVCQYTDTATKLEKDELEATLSFGDGQRPGDLKLQYTSASQDSEPKNEGSVSVVNQEKFNLKVTELKAEPSTKLFLFRNLSCEGSPESTMTYTEFAENKQFEWEDLTWVEGLGNELSFCACQASSAEGCEDAETDHKASITLEFGEVKSLWEGLARIDLKFIEGLFVRAEQPKVPENEEE